MPSPLRMPRPWQQDPGSRTVILESGSHQGPCPRDQRVPLLQEALLHILLEISLWTHKRDNILLLSWTLEPQL